jgi:hypothetical protein
MKLTKALGFAGALLIAALVGGTLIGSTLATDEETDTDAGAGAAYCETFREALATELGVTADELSAAGKAAALSTVDAAVAAGDLDEERAAALTERIEAWDGVDCGGLGHGAFGLGFARGFENGLERGVGRGLMGAGLLETAADTLGLEAADLHDQLAEGATLQEVAGDQYDAVKAALLAEVQATLDERVADGMDQARADEILDGVSTWLEEGGELRGPGARMGPGMGRGHGHGPGGMWDDSDDEAEESGT